MTRASLITGPAKCLLGTTAFFTNDNFQINLRPTTKDITTSAHGLIDRRVLRYDVETSVVPDGRWSAAIIAALWPYGATLPGTSIFGATDTVFEAHAQDGALHRIIAAAVTGCPDLILGPDETMIGSVRIAGVIGDNMDTDDANSVYQKTTGATFTDSTFVATLIKTQRYFATWTGKTGFTAVEPQKDFRISFNLNVTPVVIQGVLRDMRFNSLEVLVRFVPALPTEAEILTALVHQGTGALPGRSLYSAAAQLQITGEDGVNVFTAPKAALVDSTFAFGGEPLRTGELGFYIARNYSSGVPQALYTLAAS